MTGNVLGIRSEVSKAMTSRRDNTITQVKGCTAAGHATDRGEFLFQIAMGQGSIRIDFDQGIVINDGAGTGVFGFNCRLAGGDQNKRA
jgi:hypothetical protein